MHARNSSIPSCQLDASRLLIDVVYGVRATMGIPSASAVAAARCADLGSEG